MFLRNKCKWSSKQKSYLLRPRFGTYRPLAFSTAFKDSMPPSFSSVEVASTNMYLSKLEEVQEGFFKSKFRHRQVEEEALANSCNDQSGFYSCTHCTNDLSACSRAWGQKPFQSWPWVCTYPSQGDLGKLSSLAASPEPSGHLVCPGKPSKTIVLMPRLQKETNHRWMETNSTPDVFFLQVLQVYTYLIFFSWVDMERYFGMWSGWSHGLV